MLHWQRGARLNSGVYKLEESEEEDYQKKQGHGSESCQEF